MNKLPHRKKQDANRLAPLQQAHGIHFATACHPLVRKPTVGGQVDQFTAPPRDPQHRGRHMKP
eukprot:7834918-Pyramimonas_sp.AAC.2